MRFKEFYSRIRSEMPLYDTNGLIDEMSVYDWVLEGIKSFGSISTIKVEKVIDVVGGRALLPDGFFNLYLAAKCDPHSYEVTEDFEDVIQEAFLYKTRESFNKFRNACDQCEPCVHEDKESCVIETVTLRKGAEAKLKYKKPTFLRLTPYIQRERCASNCINLGVKDSEFEININNNYLYTNFAEGSIYIIYNGLEEDEDGFVIIPDTPKGNMLNFLLYKVKRMLLETMLLNSDNSTNEQTLYSLFKQQEDMYQLATRSELAMKNIGIGLTRYKDRVKREFEMYNFGD